MTSEVYAVVHGLGWGEHSVTEFSCENTWMAWMRAAGATPFAPLGPLAPATMPATCVPCSHPEAAHAPPPEVLEFTPPGHTDDVNGSPRPRALE